MKIRRTGSSKEQEQRCSRAGKNTSKEDRFEETNIVCYNLTIFSKRVPVLRISRVRVESMRVLHTISTGPPFPVANRETVPSHRTKSARNRDARNIMTNQCTKTLRGATLPLGGEREDLRNFLRLVLQLPAIWETPLPDGQALGIQYHPGTTLLLRASARALSLALHLRLTLLLLALAAARSLLRRVMLALIACVAPGSLPPHRRRGCVV